MSSGEDSNRLSPLVLDLIAVAIAAIGVAVGVYSLVHGHGVARDLAALQRLTEGVGVTIDMGPASQGDDRRDVRIYIASVAPKSPLVIHEVEAHVVRDGSPVQGTEHPAVDFSRLRSFVNIPSTTRQSSSYATIRFPQDFKLENGEVVRVAVRYSNGFEWVHPRSANSAGSSRERINYQPGDEQGGLETYRDFEQSDVDRLIARGVASQDVIESESPGSTD